MKTKDLILGGVIILNLFFGVTLAAVVLSGPAGPVARPSVALESAALGATSMSTAGYYHICPIKIQNGQDALAVIDTGTQQINFYVAPQGTRAFARTQPPLNLAVGFGHPKIQ